MCAASRPLHDVPGTPDGFTAPPPVRRLDTLPPLPSLPSFPSESEGMNGKREWVEATQWRLRGAFTRDTSFAFGLRNSARNQK